MFAEIRHSGCTPEAWRLASRDEPSPRKRERERERERERGREGEREREKHFESDGDASRTAECHYAYHCGGGHSTPNLFPICIRARRRRSVLQSGHSMSSRARARPHSITHSVSPSSTRVRTSALEQPASIVFCDGRRSGKRIYLRTVLDDIRIPIAHL